MFGTKTDADIKRDVINELMWDPSISSRKVTVSVNEGIVTLNGDVPHYYERVLVERATQRVKGVKGVADELQVKGTFEKTDEEIARVASDAINWNYTVPDGIKVSVDKGWVTLRGEVEWDYQRNAAKDSVSQLMGVTGVTNDIVIKSKVQPTDIKKRIEEALKRSSEIEGRKISVSVNGDVVTLIGTVHSFAESEDAKHAAWMAPGVLTVDNQLKIEQ